MAEAVAAQFSARRFPTAVGFGGGWKSDVKLEGVQQAVRVEIQQIFFIAQHCVAKRTVEQANLVKRERLGSDLNFHLRHFRRCVECEGRCCLRESESVEWVHSIWPAGEAL